MEAEELEKNKTNSKETSVKETPKASAPVVVEKSTNPYVMARMQVLKELPAWKRHEIEDMEKNKNTRNQHYQDFVKSVAQLGDKLSG